MFLVACVKASCGSFECSNPNIMMLPLPCSASTMYMWAMYGPRDQQYTYLTLIKIDLILLDPEPE